MLNTPTNGDFAQRSKRILITGARAPVCLELVRHFRRGGAIVYVADSLILPTTRASRDVEKAFIVPSPRYETLGFIDKLCDLIQKYQIDLLVPTCEEVFFIAQSRERLAQYCEVFCDGPAKLKSIHSKWEFAQITQGCGLSVPRTFHLTSRISLDSLPIPLEALVFKPEFSRFASFTLISPEKSAVAKLEITSQNPWVMQERIHGKEYCSYGVAQNGKLLAHSCYHPKYRVGLGAGVYFEPSDHPVIENFVREWVKKLNFHGQFGFDFIEQDDGEVFVLECNPRGTSGAHLFPLGSGLDRAFMPAEEGFQPGQVQADFVQSKMVLPGVVFFAAWKEVRQGKGYQLLKDFLKARDVCFAWRDMMPFFLQFVGLGELFWRSMTWRMDVKAAATADLEWNGE